MKITHCRHAVTDLMWRQVTVSAFLRYENYCPSLVNCVPAFVRYAAASTPDDEEDLLQAVLDLYCAGVPQAVRPSHSLVSVVASEYYFTDFLVKSPNN